MERLTNDPEDHPSQRDNSHKQYDETWHHLETETATSEFANEGKAIGEQILASEEINKSKRAGM